MIHSSYFVGAYAIHGYHSVPVFAASHGCLRVPPAEALWIFRWIRLGTRVDVYP
jgi:lipoprotein-anchoring transpeptidase ErfK/SrfK